MSIELRKIREEDLVKIMHWRMLPEVTYYMYTDPELTFEKQFLWHKKIINDNTAKYWIIAVDEKDVGVLNLSQIDYQNKNCAWAYYIADNSKRGSGIGQLLECNINDFVFLKMKLNKIWCEVFEFNDYVIKIHRKLGCRVEGKFLQHIFKNNEYHNVIRMSILADEWKNIRSNYRYEIIEIEY